MGQVRRLDNRAVFSPNGKRPVCIKIAPGLFALVGGCGVSEASTEISVLVDGRPVKGPVFTLPLREMTDYRLVLTVFSADLETARRLSWSVWGWTLVDGDLKDSVISVGPDPAQLLQTCASDLDRLDLARRLIEFSTVYLKRQNDPEVLAFASGLVEALGADDVSDKVLCVELGPKSTLLIAQELDGLSELRGAQAIGAFGYRRSSGASLLLRSKNLAFWIFDLPQEELQRAETVLWGPERVYRVPRMALPAGTFAQIFRIIEGQPAETNRAVLWLKNVIGLLAREDGTMRRRLREVDAAAIGEKNPVVSFTGPVCLGITCAVRAGDGSLSVFGWAEDPHDLIAKIDWMAADGAEIDLSEKLRYLDHYGLAETGADESAQGRRRGFCASVRAPSTCVPYGSEMFRVTLSSGAAKSFMVLPAARDARNARDLLLSLPKPSNKIEDLFSSGLGKTIASLHKDFLSAPRVERDVVIGELPAFPRSSIVVPLYKNLSFLKAQYAALAMDKDLAKDELIYVVDDPDSSEAVEAQLRALNELYGLPLRIIFHRRNCGYAPAVNSGAVVGRADRLLLLNSDVVPKTPHFLRALLRAMPEGKRIGAVGPKLLFANGTLQHAGLTFERDASGRIFNRSLFKGYPEDHRPANRPRTVEALTGACLLIDRDAWEAAGGMPESYVVGDFEDTDFCLRLGREGWSLAYQPKSVLYHFERQSIDLHKVHRTSCAESYNRWHHQMTWFPEDAGTRIAARGRVGELEGA